MDIWTPLTAIGTVAAAGIAAWAARQARVAATTLTDIESQRHHSELTPWLRLRLTPLNPGSVEALMLHVGLVGPPGLDKLDRLTVSIRNDHFLRGAGAYRQHAGGPTQEQVKAHVWGPYRFVPGVGPDDSRADSMGREVVYDAELPIGEELPFELQRTTSAPWMHGTTDADWQRDRGTVIRFALTCEHNVHGPWHLKCEVDVAALPVTVLVPQSPHL
jgi:hypothetical protein